MQKSRRHFILAAASACLGLGLAGIARADDFEDGREWAADNGIGSSDDCASAPDGLSEGCQAWADENLPADDGPVGGSDNSGSSDDSGYGDGGYGDGSNDGGGDASGGYDGGGDSYDGGGNDNGGGDDE